jgi:hypothetical protein
MIAVNSNCSRVDAVKASAQQLQMQLEQAPQTTPESSQYRKAQSQLQGLEAQVKSNNAQKAETALSTAKSAVQALHIQSTPSATATQPGLDVYA